MTILETTMLIGGKKKKQDITKANDFFLMLSLFYSKTLNDSTLKEYCPITKVAKLEKLQYISEQMASISIKYYSVLSQTYCSEWYRQFAMSKKYYWQKTRHIFHKDNHLFVQ